MLLSYSLHNNLLAKLIIRWSWWQRKFLDLCEMCTLEDKYDDHIFKLWLSVVTGDSHDFILQSPRFWLTLLLLYSLKICTTVYMKTPKYNPVWLKKNLKKWCIKRIFGSFRNNREWKMDTTSWFIKSFILQVKKSYNAFQRCAPLVYCQVLSTSTP